MVLSGTLQSWGLRGCFNNRDTHDFPTKSAITGMLCAAMGLTRNDPSSLGKMSSFTMLAVTVKRGSIYTDYHTVGQGHSDIMRQIPTASSFMDKDNHRHNAETDRDYLCDYTFIVILTGDVSFIDRCAEALDNPVYSVFLGRKACIPSRPILECVTESDEKVKEILLSYGVHEGSDCEYDSDTGHIIRDNPINFLTREYAPRMVSNEADERPFLR